MWDPRCLITLLASTACYRDKFPLPFLPSILNFFCFGVHGPSDNCHEALIRAEAFNCTPFPIHFSQITVTFQAILMLMSTLLNGMNKRVKVSIISTPILKWSTSQGIPWSVNSFVNEHSVSVRTARYTRCGNEGSWTVQKIKYIKTNA
jgi:hypothetical protein